MNPRIKTYTDTVLKPYLYGIPTLPSKYADLIVQDVQNRLVSLASLWPTQDFVDALRATVMDEAFFYEPQDVPLAVREFVVLGIRNSLLEDYHAVPHDIILETHIKTITRTAIEYFKSGEILTEGGTEPKRNPYSQLPERYPIAWNAMTNLYRLGPEGGKAQYAPLNVTLSKFAKNIDKNKSKNQSPLSMKFDDMVYSGMSSGFSSNLSETMRYIRQGKTKMFSSASFKWLTRHPEKTFRIMEFILFHDAMFVTLNTVLTKEWVIRRSNFIRPPHMVDELIPAFLDTEGTDEAHAILLRICAQMHGAVL